MSYARGAHLAPSGLIGHRVMTRVTDPATLAESRRTVGVAVFGCCQFERQGPTNIPLGMGEMRVGAAATAVVSAKVGAQ